MTTKTQQYDSANSTDSTNSTKEKNQSTKSTKSTISTSVLPCIWKYPKYIARLTKTDKLRTLYYDTPDGLTDKEASEKLYGTAEETNNIRGCRTKIPTKIQRLNDERPAKFGLTATARAEVKAKFDTYLEELRIANELEAIENSSRKLPALIREFVLGERLDKAQLTRGTKGTNTFEIQWTDLIQDPELADHFIQDPENIVRQMQNELKNATEKEWTAVLVGFNDRQKIARIRTEQYGKLLNIHGELRSIGGVKDRTVVARFECMSCEKSIPFIVSMEATRTPNKPKMCKCGSKSFSQGTDEVIQVQNITVQEIPELLEPGENPTAMPCIVRGGLSEELADKFKQGDHLTLTGTYIRQPEEFKPEYNRVFLVLGVRPIENSLLKVELTQEARAELKRIREAEDPLKELSQQVYKNVVGHDTAKEIVTAQAFGDFHVLLLGEPGVGKTLLAKCTAQAVMRGGFFQATNSTATGLTAAAVKDEHTNRFTLETNGIARLHPHGIACIDELEKGKETVQHSLLGVMEDRVIKKNTANVQATVPCDVTILGTANPIKDEFDEYSFENLAKEVKLPNPLYDRFNFVIPFALDTSKIKIFDKYFMVNSIKQTELVSMTARLVMRELMRNAWRVPIDVTNAETLEKMNVFMREIIVPNPNIFGKSLRVTKTLPSLLSALCRVTGDTIPGAYHFQKAGDLLRGVESLYQEVKQVIAERNAEPNGLVTHDKMGLRGDGS